MTNEQVLFITKGQALALCCVKVWLKDVPRAYWPEVKEVDELTAKITHRADRLFYPADGSKPTISEEVLEEMILEAVPWLNWPRFGPFTWNEYTLFSHNLETEALFNAKEGGCSGG